MPLAKATGNMYEWVSHMHTHLDGDCPHACQYCYVGKSRFGRPERYKGEIRLIEKELHINYGSGKTIFIEHMTDLFADSIPEYYITVILFHCNIYPNNTYVFQTKNPIRVLEFKSILPDNSIIGCTIESDFNGLVSTYSKAPLPIYRYHAMCLLPEFKKFITIEPIMSFGSNLISWIKYIKPDFINIGADSKNCNLPEPTKQEVEDLIKSLKDNGLTVRIKSNLARLL